MAPSRRWVLRSMPVAILAGCSAPRADDTWVGLFSRGFEESVFEPCTVPERWWVVNDAELVERYQAVADRDYEQVFARVRGTLSDRGSYGHGGQYPRQLEVTGVLEVRERRPDDC